MATNEHKNLSDDNLHVPKGFDGAGTNTIPSKNASSELEWISETAVRVSHLEIQGYCTAPSGDQLGYYEYRAGLTDGQAPFEFNADYGSGTAASQVFDVSDIFRTKGQVMSSAGTLTKIQGWGTSSGAPTITIAIMKVTPVDNVAGDLTPVLLDEFSFTGAGNDITRSISRGTGDIAVSSLAAGDIIIPMVKSSLGSSVIYFNLSLEVRMS